MKRRASTLLGLALAAGMFGVQPSPSIAASEVTAPASPFDALGPRFLVPRFLDVGPVCVELIPEEERVEGDRVFERLRGVRRDVRLATRIERSELREELERLARSSKAPLTAICARLERTRLALRMGFGPEARAELRRAARLLPRAEWPSGLRDLSRYLEVESLVAMRRGSEGVDASLAASKSDIAELALAAQLRHFDLTTRIAIIPPSTVLPAPRIPRPPAAASTRAAEPPVEAVELGPDPASTEGPAPEASAGDEALAAAEVPEPRAEEAAATAATAGPEDASEAPTSEAVAAASAPDAAPAIEAPKTETPYAQWKKLDELLTRARSKDFDLSSWATRAAEHAFAAGRLSNAHQWFAVAEGVPASRRLAAIRKSDVLMRLARPDDARRTLQRVAKNAREPEVRDFARVRLARYALVTEGAEERLRLLKVASRSEHPVVAALARDQLAIEYLVSGDPDAALPVLRKIAYNAPTLHHVPRFANTLDTALAATVDGRDCSAVLGRLARSWELFLRHASQPEPFVAVAECFVEMGMSKEALLVYRALARSLGVDSVPHLAWRLASASLASGDLASARASLRASLRPLGGDVPLSKEATQGALRIPDEAAAQWWWLASEFAAREGRDEEASHIDLALLRGAHLPESLRPSVEARLMDLVVREPGEAARIDPYLAASLRHETSSDAPDRALARVQLADRVWEAGGREAAGSAYRRLRTAVDVPTPRNRAEYRGAIAAEPADATRELLRDAASGEPFNAWSRLSRVELRLMRLRESVGFPSQVRP